MRAPGLAGPDETSAYAARFTGTTAAGHFRTWNGLTLSSVGIGTYLGAPDAKTDVLYRNAALRSFDLGCNVVDTAVNYRFQRSERAVGEALSEAFARGLARGAVLVSTKGGFFPFESRPPEDSAAWIEETFIRPGIVSSGEIAANCHCMTPMYLRNQLETSLRNLHLEAVDIYYVHNPETQLPEVGRSEFLKRILSAFEFLESAAREGKIGVYGVATWSGFRVPEDSPGYLSLAELEEAARQAGGENHRFRAVQLPVNLAMPEALVRVNQRIAGEMMPLLSAASRLGMIVMSSGSIYQGQLARGLPPAVGRAFSGLNTDAQRALQFARSAPGLTTALVGMKTPAHVEENLALAAHAPAAAERFGELFG